VGSRLLVVAVLSLLTASWSPGQNAAPPAGDPSAQVDALFQKMDTTVTPGCALAVVKDGKIIYLRTEDDSVLRVTVRGDALQVGWGKGEETYELKAITDNHFRLAIAARDFTFEAAKPGGSPHLIVSNGGDKSDVFAEIPAFAPSETELKGYAGTYSSQEIDPLYEIKLEQSGLVLHRLKSKPDSLLPVTRDFFVGSIGNIRFTRNARGEISGFLLSDGRILNFRFEKGRPAIPSS
jgi:hypothetical protein